MRLYFKNARLINPETGTDELGGLFVVDGLISDAIDVDRVIDCRGKCLAPGIVDIGVKVSEPGERHKESFASAGRAAIAGGITTIVTRPDTVPAIDTPETLEFIERRASIDAAVNVLPMAALTKGRLGREMTEIGFLLDAGAVAFTDCDRIVTNTKIFSRVLTYAHSLGALVIGHVQEPGLSDGGSVTSGKFATLRGLTGISPLAERMGLDRVFSLLETTLTAYNFVHITTARALPALVHAMVYWLNFPAWYV